MVAQFYAESLGLAGAPTLPEVLQAAEMVIVKRHRSHPRRLLRLRGSGFSATSWYYSRPTHMASVSYYLYSPAFASIYPNQAIVVLYIAGEIYSLPLEHW